MPGVRQIEDLLGIPVLGVIPHEKFALDEEDSLTERLSRPSCLNQGSGLNINVAVIRLPRLSNFTDFAVFDSLQIPLNYVDTPRALDHADLIIIPGSKNTIGDMLFLEKSGLAQAIKAKAQKDCPIVGICGGFQILGRAIHDPHGVEGKQESIAGLNLLDVETTLALEKNTVQAHLSLAEHSGPLAGTAGLLLAGYEIHMGQTNFGPLVKPLSTSDGNQALGAITENGQIFGSYLHGFFDNLEFTRKFMQNIAGASSWGSENDGQTLGAATYQELKEREYDRLAALVESKVTFETLLKITGLN